LTGRGARYSVYSITRDVGTATERDDVGKEHPEICARVGHSDLPGDVFRERTMMMGELFPDGLVFTIYEMIETTKNGYEE
jgi:hypothetical protein